MDIEISPPARRHRISDERIRYVIQHAPEAVEIGGGVLGFFAEDQNAISLEVLGRLREGRLEVFHAQRLGTHFAAEFARLHGRPGR